MSADYTSFAKAFPLSRSSLDSEKAHMLYLTLLCFMPYSMRRKKSTAFRHDGRRVSQYVINCVVRYTPPLENHAPLAYLSLSALRKQSDKLGANVTSYGQLASFYIHDNSWPRTLTSSRGKYLLATWSPEARVWFHDQNVTPAEIFPQVEPQLCGIVSFNDLLNAIYELASSRWWEKLGYQLRPSTPVGKGASILDQKEFVING